MILHFTLLVPAGLLLASLDGVQKRKTVTVSQERFTKNATSKHGQQVYHLK